MSRSKSSKRWLQAHFTDVYVKKAQTEGYRSRAVYKLKEFDEKNHLLKPGMTVIDLGAAPGGWSQYALEKLKGQGKIIALDQLAIEDLPGIHFIQGDFREEAILQQLMNLIPQQGVDLLLSDMAPNMSGSAVIDIPRAMYLAELAVDLAQKVLRHEGVLLIKIFHGTGFDALIKKIRTEFKSISIRKPQASRAQSRETYLLAKGYKGYTV